MAYNIRTNSIGEANPMKLIRYKENWWQQFIWFWVDDEDKVCSPEFNSKEDANMWYGQQIREWQSSDS